MWHELTQMEQLRKRVRGWWDLRLDLIARCKNCGVAVAIDDDIKRCPKCGCRKWNYN